MWILLRTMLAMEIILECHLWWWWVKSVSYTLWNQPHCVQKEHTACNWVIWRTGPALHSLALWSWKDAYFSWTWEIYFPSEPYFSSLIREIIPIYLRGTENCTVMYCMKCVFITILFWVQTWELDTKRCQVIKVYSHNVEKWFYFSTFYSFAYFSHSQQIV